MYLTARLLLSISTALPVGAAPSPPAPVEPVATLRRCEVEFLKSTDLGASQIGVLEECLVEQGDFVKAGQVLARLVDDDAQTALELRTFQAESTIEIRISEARRDQAREKLRASEILLRKNALSAEEYNLRRLDALTAELAVEEAEYRRRTAELEARQSEALLRLREFIAPHDGVVAEIYKDPGEAVSPNEPVIRLIDVGRVRVTGHLDVADAWRVEPGQPVRIAPDIGGTELEVEKQWFTGNIVFIDPQIDPQTQTCEVIAEVPNPDRLLRAGLEARMQILDAADSADAEKISE